MYKNRSVLAVIPARGGSKGVPRKNVREVGGKPLIAWTIEAAKNAATVDRVVLSSDDPEIIAAARAWDCEVPFVRPAALAADDTPGIAPFVHAVSELGGCDYAVLLQPTSPLRTAEDIDSAVALCIDRDASSVVSVVASDKHPAWMYTLNDLRLEPVMPDVSGATRRQDLPAVYSLNGAVYVVRAKNLMASNRIVDGETVAFIMPKERSIDIDTEFDMMVADQWLRRQYSNHIRN